MNKNRVPGVGMAVQPVLSIAKGRGKSVKQSKQVLAHCSSI